MKTDKEKENRAIGLLNNILVNWYYYDIIVTLHASCSTVSRPSAPRKNTNYDHHRCIPVPGSWYIYINFLRGWDRLLYSRDRSRNVLRAYIAILCQRVTAVYICVLLFDVACLLFLFDFIRNRKKKYTNKQHADRIVPRILEVSKRVVFKYKVSNEK